MKTTHLMLVLVVALLFSVVFTVQAQVAPRQLATIENTPGPFNPNPLPNEFGVSG